MAPPTKKRKTDPKIEEITFDLSARQDYLTGFHKRKLQRAKFAQEKAAERARSERIEQRKKIRDERKADLERHVKEVNDLLRPLETNLNGENGQHSDEDEQEEDMGEWTGIQDVEPEPIDHEAEYIDEDKYTTVTVEAMDVSKEGLMKIEEEELDGRESGNATKQEGEAEAEDVESVSTTENKKNKRPWIKDNPKDKDKPRKPKKKRNFRYEGKLDRKANRVKQRRKNSEQAKARKTG